MNLSCSKRLSIPLALAAMLPVAAQASELSRVLECRDAAALTTASDAVLGLGRDAGMDCRTDEHQRRTTVYCTGGRATAFAQAVKEFNLVRDTRGGATLQVAFTGSPGRLTPVLERERSAADAGQPLSQASWDQREDGVAELHCTVQGAGSGFGAISGRLDFRGVEPLPAMRVCAAPVRAPQTPSCVETRSGESSYLIENLEPGDYYVTSFALQHNPNRLFGIFSTRLTDCPDGDPACVGRRLQPVSVYADDVRDGIDPDTLLERLPSPLRAAAHGR